MIKFSWVLFENLYLAIAASSLVGTCMSCTTMPHCITIAVTGVLLIETLNAADNAIITYLATQHLSYYRFENCETGKL